jgi:hypothetical protein
VQESFRVGQELESGFLKGLTMNAPKKPKVIVRISHLIQERVTPEMRGLRLTLEEVKKYASPQPLRRPPPRSK